MGVRSSFFDEPCWKKTVVSFRVLSSFETTILLRSSSSESSLSRLSRPRHGKYRSKIMFSVSKCRYVFRLSEKKEEAKKEKEKSPITFNLGYQKKKREILLLFPQSE